MVRLHIIPTCNFSVKMEDPSNIFTKSNQNFLSENIGESVTLETWSASIEFVNEFLKTEL